MNASWDGGVSCTILWVIVPLTSDLVFRKIVSGAYLILLKVGAQWLSGRVLDSRTKGRGFEPHRRHCFVVLEQDTFILA